MFESGAVLVYLAEKTGKLLPKTGAARYTTADIMNMMWARAAKRFIGMELGPYPSLSRWMAELEERPAFKRALEMKPSPTSPREG